MNVIESAIKGYETEKIIDTMIYVAVMIGTQGKEYRTPCRSVKQAQHLVDNYEGLGFMGWIELEETEE